jgi:predicted SAM-dependent methyltransferase
MKNKIKHLLSFSPYALYVIFRDNSKHSYRLKSQKAKIDSYIKNNEIKKIQIGCGPNLFEGWLNTDIDCNDKIAYLNAGAPFPIASDTFDFVYSEHLFEHLKVEQQINMLSESYRILKKGGILRIATPNVDFLFDIFAKPTSSESEHYVDWAVKNIPHLKAVKKMVVDDEEHYIYVINNFFKAWGHQVIHNVESISKLAMQCHFSQVRECAVGVSEVSIFKNIEKHGTILPERINLMETMVVEIMK